MRVSRGNVIQKCNAECTTEMLYKNVLHSTNNPTVNARQAGYF